MGKKRAMTSEQASFKKLRGHALERTFATIIQGEVNAGDQKDKKDVIDKQHNAHSVKGGEWWQIFLYSRNRLVTNTVLQGLGNISQYMVGCIDAFPIDREDYLNNKHAYKIRLQEPMRLLATELQEKAIFKAFISKAFFNAGEVRYLSAYREVDEKFYIFWHDDVIDTLSECLTIENSKAYGPSQYDCQKVLFKYGNNVSEIEIRTDSPVHYRQIKCRFNAEQTISLLTEKIQLYERRNEVVLYGRAVNRLSY